MAPPPPAREGLVSGSILVGLSLLGLGVAVYLTTVHYANVPLACSSTGIIDCAKVVTSQYSVIPGTSVAITVPGMAFFVVSLGMAVAQLRRPLQFNLRQWHFAWSCLGLLAVFYLVFVELVELKAICLFCTIVHAAILATLITTAWRLRPPEPTAIAN